MMTLIRRKSKTENVSSDVCIFFILMIQSGKERRDGGGVIFTPVVEGKVREGEKERPYSKNQWIKRLHAHFNRGGSSVCSEADAIYARQQIVC